MNINLVSQLLCYPLPQGKFNFFLPFCLCRLVGAAGFQITLEGLKDLGTPGSWRDKMGAAGRGSRKY